jgi:Ni/Co efflux regulator RcnB
MTKNFFRSCLLLSSLAIAPLSFSSTSPNVNNRASPTVVASQAQAKPMLLAFDHHRDWERERERERRRERERERERRREHERHCRMDPRHCHLS